MSILNNITNIKDLYVGGAPIKRVYAGSELIYEGEGIDPTYNYFVFRVNPSGIDDYTITLFEDRAGDTTVWDGLTDWGDGTIDNKLSHTYENLDINKTYAFTVKTKWVVKNLSNDSISTVVRQQLIACKNLNKNMTNMAHFFSNCAYLTTVDLSRTVANKVTDMSYMFKGCVSLVELNLKGIDTSKVTNMAYMFYNCTRLSVDAMRLDVSSVTDMQFMFYGCTSLDGNKFYRLEPIPGSSSTFRYITWDTSNVTNMGYMFYYAEVTNELRLYWDTSKVTACSYMFSYCRVYDGLQMSWYVKDSVYAYGMLAHTACRTCININHHVTGISASATQWKLMTS